MVRHQRTSVSPPTRILAHQAWLRVLEPIDQQPHQPLTGTLGYSGDKTEIRTRQAGALQRLCPQLLQQSLMAMIFDPESHGEDELPASNRQR
ncbi:MAG: hypothetical protein MMC33_008376 [Icmadophila ericetorum]|nr:hypothetical protein [Icmadophila ericetorum]